MEGQEQFKHFGSHKPVIHVVDDEPALLELASAILEPAGYTVLRFKSGEAAFRAFSESKEKPCLIITDYAMLDKEMNGLDLISACRQVHPKQKVLLVSGTVDASISKSVAHKPDRFLGKPYTPPQLLEVVQSLARP